MKLFFFSMYMLSCHYAMAWINIRLLRPRTMLILRNSERIDISPALDRSITKLVQRRGDHLKSMPMTKDTVEIAWRLFDANNTLIHDSTSPATSNSNDKQHTRSDKSHSDIIYQEDENFSFQIGAEPRQVILGWEYAVRTMREGEKAEVIVAPEFGFGEKGAPPLIQPNATLTCELELLKIIPALTRRFRSVGLNESIRVELLEQMEKGNLALTETVLNSDNGCQPPVSNANRGRDSTALKTEEYVESIDYVDVAYTPSPAPALPAAAVSAQQSATPAATAPEKNARTPQAAQARFFDPKKDKLDARLRVGGQARDGRYTWTETASVLEVEIPLRAHHSAGLRASKQDVQVVITSQHIQVTVTINHSSKTNASEEVVLLSGPLQGRVAPSTACWALQDYGDLEGFRRGAAQGLQLSVDKAHGCQDFWASVLSSEHLATISTTQLQQQ